MSSKIASGANSNVTVYFPAGFGYTLSDQVRMLEPAHVFTTALNQQLRPSNPVQVYNVVGGLFVCEESKPLLIKAGGIECDLNLGVVRATSLMSAQSVRKKEVTDLAAATGVQPGANRKRSNDAWLETASTVAGPVEIRQGSRGDARLYASGIGINPGSFETHHPLGAHIDSAGAQLFVTDDQCTASGSLTLAGPVTVPQGRDCLQCLGMPGAIGVGMRNLTFDASGGTLGITPDGGLVGNGSLNSPTDMQWGIGPRGYAQTVHGVTSGSLLIAGFALRGDQTTRGVADKPGVLLNTGSSTAPAGGTGLYPPERPDTAGYTAGTGSYAGFNFRIRQLVKRCPRDEAQIGRHQRQNARAQKADDTGKQRGLN